MKVFFKKLLIYFSFIIAFSILYILSFQLPLDSIFTVYTYKGMFLILISALILCVSLFIFKHFFPCNIDSKDVIIIVLLFAFLHLFVFCMVAVTIERSFSVFMLSEISKNDNQIITLDETKDLFTEKYVETNNAFEKRFQEQLVTGSLEQIDVNTYRMTKKGNLIVSLFHFFNNIYNVNSDLLK